MGSMRKWALVTYCSVDPCVDNKTMWSSNTIRSRSCKSTMYFKVPINHENIVLYEDYNDCDGKRRSTCQKVNFQTLCCRPTSDVNAMPITFDLYQHVKYLEFSGHIGSMKVAFQMLHKFPSVKELRFCLNEFNIESDSSISEVLGFVIQNPTIEKLTIFHNRTILETRSVGMQKGGRTYWRLNEILRLSKLCLPSIKKFEVNLVGNGYDYDALQSFFDVFPLLRNNHITEIKDGILSVRQKSACESTSVGIHVGGETPLPELGPPQTCQAIATVTTNMNKAVSIVGPEYSYTSASHVEPCYNLEPIDATEYCVQANLPYNNAMAPVTSTSPGLILTQQSSGLNFPNLAETLGNSYPRHDSIDRTHLSANLNTDLTSAARNFVPPRQRIAPPPPQISTRKNDKAVVNTWAMQVPVNGSRNNSTRDFVTRQYNVSGEMLGKESSAGPETNHRKRPNSQRTKASETSTDRKASSSSSLTSRSPSPRRKHYGKPCEGQQPVTLNESSVHRAVFNNQQSASNNPSTPERSKSQHHSRHGSNFMEYNQRQHKS